MLITRSLISFWAVCEDVDARQQVLMRLEHRSLTPQQRTLQIGDARRSFASCPITEPLTIGVLCESFLQHERGPGGRLAARTVELRQQQLRGHVIPLLGADVLACELTTPMIRGLIRELEQRGLGGSAVRGCVAAVSAIFRHGIRELAKLERNPVRDLERGDLPPTRRATEPRYLAVDEVRLLCDALTPTFRPVAAACFWGALRVSEALALRWRQVAFEQRLLFVPGTKSATSRAAVPLVAELAYELRRHQAAQATLDATRVRPEALVFQTRSGKSPGRRNVHRAVAHAAQKTGLVPPGAQPVGPHDLRHSFAAFALEGGLSLVETSRLLRHANASITGSIYAGLTDPALARLTSKLDQLAGGPTAEASYVLIESRAR